MQPDPRGLMEDIITASDHILRVTSNMDFRSFSKDFDKRSAVERWFITIGEAMRRLREHHPELATRIPDISDIIDFRNVLVHNYDDLEETIIWSTITDDLPLLYRTVCDLMNELDAPRQILPSTGPKI